MYERRRKRQKMWSAQLTSAPPSLHSITAQASPNGAGRPPWCTEPSEVLICASPSFLSQAPPTGTPQPLTCHTDVKVVTKLVSDVLHQVRSIVEASFLLFPLVTYGVCKVGGHSAGSHPTSRNFSVPSPHTHTQGQQNLEGRAFLLLKLVSELSIVALGKQWER